MPSSTNIAEWKKLSDIDYFSQFIKAWLAFNAWMRNRYNLKRDREIIEKIKNEDNDFRNKILQYISGNDAESVLFKSYISSLHYYLSKKPLPVDFM